MRHIHEARGVVRAALALGLSAGWAAAFPWNTFSGLSASPDSIAQNGSYGNCTACHELNIGPGSVQFIGVPTRYEPDAIYDIIVRIADPNQLAAGFQLSVENGPVTEPLHQGFLSSPTIHTQFAFGNPDFLTHTQDGMQNALDNWTTNGAAALYPLQWQAPSEDVGPIRFFAVGNAVNFNQNPTGDRMYIGTKTTRPFTVGPGDFDQDGDVDLVDHEAFVACLSGPVATTSGACDRFDFDADLDVDLLDAAWMEDNFTGRIPVEYVNADATRGGKLYNHWWAVNGAQTPSGDHPLYPPEGSQSGPSTFRCRECHGWDYQGADGQYFGGVHYTGIPGIYPQARPPQELFDLLKYDTNVTTNGHGMGGYGMNDTDLWDVTRFLLTEMVDTDNYITQGGLFIGDFDEGLNMYDTHCYGCHGDGTAINVGTPQSPEYVGTVAVFEPWKFLHVVRFGHPRRQMIALVDLFTPTQRAADLGVYCQTLQP